MEKKEIDKKFYLLSSFNLIPALILGGGLTIDSGILSLALLVLIFNHTILVRVVKSVTSAASNEGGATRQLGKILFLMFLKFTLLFGLIGSVYYFQKALLTKLFLIIFFQLIIQVVSIKNNYQNS
jgi:hypothetical protein